MHEQWPARLSKYRRQDNLRGVAELAVTAICFAALWAAMCSVALYMSYWPALLLTIPTAVFLLRLFILQHDCGHGTLFTKRTANDWVGRLLGILTFTPYDYWRNSHAHHHAGSGNLDRRGIGDIELKTVREYSDLGRAQRLRYRLYRHPLVMFGLGPTFLFVLQHRFPIWVLRKERAAWISTSATNVGIAAVIGLITWAVGLDVFLKVQIPVVTVAASVGVWMFYVQHQFEDTFWARSPDWTPQSAALHGSSYYHLPGPLAWLTGNIGLHHIHHLSSKIPFYRLPAVLRENPELKEVRHLTIRQSMKCVRLTLWDEDYGRLVSFAQASGKIVRLSCQLNSPSEPDI